MVFPDIVYISITYQPSVITPIELLYHKPGITMQWSGRLRLSKSPFTASFSFYKSFLLGRVNQQLENYILSNDFLVDVKFI